MRSDRERLHDMLEAAARLADAVELGRDRFDRDLLVQDAMLRRIEVLGEAAGRVSAELRERHPEVPWQQIVAMRNRAIHGYFDIDLERVWTVATVELPPLIAQLRTIRDEES